MISEEVLRSFSGKNVLVTGGTGLIGRQVVDILCEAGAYVTIASLDKIAVNDQAKHIYGDLADFSFCKEITSDMDFVFHIAGIKGSIEVTKSKPASFFVPLLMMNTNLLEASRLNKVQKLVYTSSIGAYEQGERFVETDSCSGPPMDMFPGWAKRMAELQIQAYKIQYGLDHFAVVRPCNVYGPGDNFDPANAMVIPSLLHRIYHKEDPLLIWGDGSAVRDFAYSRDVAEGTILALYHGTPSGYVNLGSGQEYTIRQVIETLRTFLDFNYAFDTNKPVGFSKRVMDITLARETIGYNPTTSLLDGLKQTWDWYVENTAEYQRKVNYFR
ncbi:NAD-dependent epimerase/dehydratase family protein [Heliobacillus mobilis]|uniref:NAD-dependent epimerase/dehydratase family protein n=1 Tax=Heliobacterium mobile TaxID=28064 RepID=A0A6I3SL30_HELMO|nr:NAD-dependent epimerase/dehydratase family protein [Heliobacterium mobile]MTV49678.1 NAD-dependent epimerase/dehydratase family protein [Heliobacterium mobile]